MKGGLVNQFIQENVQEMFYVITLKIENKGKETKNSSRIRLTNNSHRYNLGVINSLCNALVF